MFPLGHDSRNTKKRFGALGMREEEGKQLTSFNSNWRRLRLHIADFFPMFSTDLKQFDTCPWTYNRSDVLLCRPPEKTSDPWIGAVTCGEGERDG